MKAPTQLPITVPKDIDLDEPEDNASVDGVAEARVVADSITVKSGPDGGGPGVAPVSTAKPVVVIETLPAMSLPEMPAPVGTGRGVVMMTAYGRDWWEERGCDTMILG